MEHSRQVDPVVARGKVVRKMANALACAAAIQRKWSSD
jgi:hypothetical protein